MNGLFNEPIRQGGLLKNKHSKVVTCSIALGSARNSMVTRCSLGSADHLNRFSVVLAGSPDG